MPRKITKVKTSESGSVDEAPVLKTSTRSVRGKRGGLAGMPQMPIDIILEILSHLHPADLLSLARTSKDLRALLMSRSSAFLWKASRKNVDDLPEPPTHLSEPAYANLLFSNHCHSCLKGNIKTALWLFSVRFCPKCKEARLVDCLEIDVGWDLRATNCPGEYYGSGKTLMAIESPFRRHGMCYLRSEVEEVVKKWRAFGGDTEERRAFIVERTKYVKELKDWADACSEWARKISYTRGRELWNVRKSRVQTIYAKLREAGWEEEISRLTYSRRRELERHKHMSQSKVLTERVWANIKDVIFAVMEKFKQDRLHNELQVILTSRLNILLTIVSEYYAEQRLGRNGAIEYLPCFSDIAVMPPIRTLIDVPAEQEMSRETLLPVKDMLPVLMDEWQRTMKSTFAGTLRTNQPDAPNGVGTNADADTAILDLATSYFACKSCKKMTYYPVALTHGCFRPSCLLGGSAGHTTDEYTKRANNIVRRTGWNADRVGAPSAMQIAAVRRIVELCGQDPARVTTGEMDALECRLCLPMAHAMAVFSWRAAIQEEVLEPHRNWTLATSEQRRLAKKLEAESPLNLDMQPLWWCGLCGSMSGWDSRARSLPLIKEHLGLRHDIKEPDEAEGHYFANPDALARQSRMVFLQESKEGAA